MSSTLGSGCVSRSTLALRGFRSMQIRTFPSFFGTTTIPAHHSVGAFTLEMTPRDSMRLNSFWTLLRSGKGIFLGVYSATGLASGLR